MDIHRTLMRIPHRPTSLAALDFHDRWHDFLTEVGDSWWQLRFEKRHRPRWDSPFGKRRCRCGVIYYDEDGWHTHRQMAKEKEWDKRFD